LPLQPEVTFFVGDNGSGKSTLVEAIAVAAGFNPEGGSRNFTFATRPSHSELHEHLRLSRSTRRASTGYFLRAESFFNVATELDALQELDRGALASYGGRSLHEQSHGESFLSLVVNRFGADGFYVLDEPEAALSLQGQLAVLRRVHDLCEAGSQFAIATHSPILLAYPNAVIYELSDDGIERVAYTDTQQYQLTKGFLDSPEAFLRHLFAD
jgi:predicted ATPase